MWAFLGFLLLLVLFLGLLGGVAIVATAVARAIKRALQIVARFLQAGLIASIFAALASFTVAVSSSATSNPNVPTVVVSATVVIWIVAFAILQRMSGFSAQESWAAAPDIGADEIPNRSSDAQTLTVPTAVHVKDAVLDQLCTQLADLMPSRANEIRTALIKCDEIEDAADRAPHELSLVEWANFVRRRIPELVNTTLENLDEATTSGRSKLLDGLSHDLQSIAAEADRRLSKVAEGRKTRLAILRRHVANRTSENLGFLDKLA